VRLYTERGGEAIVIGKRVGECDRDSVNIWL
jgi:hypothetical protein